MNMDEAMLLAINVAREASLLSDDVPVGAVILNSLGKVIATGGNERELSQDPTEHAEIVAIRRAAALLGTWRLDGHTLVVTLEPCSMCAGAIVQSRISTLVFGAWDEKAGAVGSVWDVVRDPRTLNKVVVSGGVMAEECAGLLTDFFQGRRIGNIDAN
jgi:tRNA(adenine34) deaminase